ncbi:LOB domain-containing protein 16-like [Cucurbita pepo subsp. pepo]|uniref:LOB domain-containing protein 16-like n=1 Tax=Cucurbita pepo subsp. pepo TaxID=3664 RepID=UPI000C9D5093|nr:LOB domain-containing protein 16-like [Cucurbita pepo subsp. pepo]
MASSTTANSHVSASASASPSPSPCGACKFLRRKCAPDCIFAPYFCSEQSAARFAAIHKVFGASNVSKLLLHVPVPHRCEAVVSIAYEAQARIRDPVYGCVAHLFALQQQVAYLQTQLMQARAQLAQTHMQIQWTGIPKFPNYQSQVTNSAVSPQTSLESAANNDEAQFQQFPTKIPASCHGDVGELQALALRMMRN